MEKTLWNYIRSVRKTAPLIHNITNLVVMNNTANALLAVGASPVMAHAKSEVEDMTAIANSLLVNIGTIDEYWSEAMMMAAEKALDLQKPWVLDPVGAGATPFRDTILQKLLSFRPTVIRGNASEIIALAKFNTTATKGVDSTHSSTDAVEAATLLLENDEAVICISGETDIIMDRGQTIFINNGHPMMTKITGMGCTASALVAAFIAAAKDKTEATAAAMGLLGVAGELSEKKSDGPGSLQMNIIDKLYNIEKTEFWKYVKVWRK